MKPLVIKLGGVLLDTPAAMENLFTALADYQQNFARPLLIVHGGGCLVDDLMKRLNLPVQKKNGLRVTPADQIDIIVGALAGIANKTLVAQAAKFKLNPVGLCLADGNLTQATQFDPELGHVAMVVAKNPALLNNLLGDAFLPIISSIAVDDNGLLMNVNADQAATAIAALINADLVMLSDVDGVLDANKQRLTELNSAQIEQLIEDKVITDGMIVKVNAALDAAKILNCGVDIANWKYPEKLTALFAGEIIGTRINP
ncbi:MULTISPECIES: acetylglutamate kinase [Basfia]|uniref:Acetylglutamate kinase n=2 Tax=Basfia TaxID=697331 RepID=ARGB_MANSM|nr:MULTISPECIES: acetylglutamate kinase [Basfia]Q65W17.1 RecName: Full=Acetylglutamate kinase; AltName: Full=N-acetyl-L-glutamate 5-phosphotransferase; AltName: Full=NAG kinase; Short=NAGK [[Mannheimia] succiniciproducens MBEL55E]AAU36843.1 ArgB protein [[Mannheimia] succiniciproducens MBEL55E]QIM69634.1 acetylglutamate kinase [Basfia succiniciproducens]SCX82992.1 N-acetylglutamate kinase [Basfia succiniciproducens]SEQ09761.1 N-acetylglutamate kinase [Basfia succiniciproducens]